jgi:hypothetical protein
MHFQRVFLSMDAVAEDDLRQVAQPGNGGEIEWNIAERCGESRAFR